MSKILELREKRAKVWDAAKAFLDSVMDCYPQRTHKPMKRWKLKLLHLVRK